MSATYIPIQSTTLTTSAASVTFSNIPATYTDLVVRISARADASSATNSVSMRINDVTTNRSITFLRGTGSGVTSAQGFDGNIGTITGATATASTFGDIEVYIPNYLSSANKPFSSFSVQEDNNASAFIFARAHLWQSSAAITQLRFESLTSANFVSGSTFHLYGIKNS